MRVRSLLVSLLMVLTLVPFTVTEASAATTSTTARVVRWSDGDTVVTTRGKVRLIGMDTPELSRNCGTTARAYAKRLAPIGSTVTLTKVAGRDNQDHYDRYLRYVNRGKTDVGYAQIRAGLGDARYDSGSYGSHPRRSAYRSADAKYADRRC